MNAAKIREGLEYAFSEHPRKRVKEEDLHKVEGIRRVRVDKKGLERWAPTAKDNWGDPDGAYKSDGIRIIYLDKYTGDPIILSDGMTPYTEVVKPRDILLPYVEYLDRVESDQRERERRQAEREERERIFQEKVDSAIGKLREIPALEEDADWWETSGTFRFTPNGVTKLVGYIGEMVYQILSEQE